MAVAYYVLDGKRYLSSGGVAKLLGIEQRTVVRWAERIRKGKCPELLKKLVWVRDPLNGRTYFEERSVKEVQKLLIFLRPIRSRTKKEDHS